MRFYNSISKIYMANDSQVDIVETHPCPTPEHLEEFKFTCDDIADEFYTSKESALEASNDAPVLGYGKHSGRKLWQLPNRIKQQIKLHLTPCNAPNIKFKKPKIAEIAKRNWQDADYRAKIKKSREAKKIAD